MLTSDTDSSDGHARSREAEHRQTTRFYDAEAPCYHRSRYETPGGRRVDAFHKAMLQSQLFDRLAASPRILEVGCGTGRLLNHFAARYPAIEGIDASAGMLAVARTAAQHRLSLVQGSAYTLPYADETFDGAYALLVLNLLTDIVAVLREMRRVLRRQGLFLFNVPNLASIYAPGGLWVNLRGRTTGSNRAGHRYSHWYTRAEITSALETAGLEPVSFHGQPPLLSLGWRSAPLPGTPPLSALCKSLYVVARKTQGRA